MVLAQNTYTEFISFPTRHISSDHMPIELFYSRTFWYLEFTSDQYPFLIIAYCGVI